MKNLIAAWSRLLQHRFGPAVLLASLAMAFSLLSRIAILLLSASDMGFAPFSIIGAFLIGLFYDSISALFFSALLMLYLWLTPRKLYRQHWQRTVLYAYFIISLIILVFNFCGEIIFWLEYHNRFDFIAVDYLVYTHEVIQNIVESYPIFWILACIVIAALTVFFIIRQHLHASQTHPIRFGRRSIVFVAYAAIGAFAFFFLTNRFKNFTNNNYINELAGNGMYDFATAYLNNELPYEKYYRILPDSSAFVIARQQLQSPDAKLSGNDLFSVTRNITPDSAEKKWNVVLVSVESLSGDYMRYFGNAKNITPYLDSLIPHSLFFTKFYATGTRTVRGLEALSLAIPPTPGQSIVRRPKNSDLFSMGNVLAAKGYDCRFIYGGNAWFDNMGPYFGANGYRVVDKRDFNNDDIHHTTAWGACDEDIFTQALKECDASFNGGKLFFNHVMTVSNHRPYTFPKGRIANNPDDQSREGAVTYSDWAIHDFLQRARSKPWFNNTLFVIVADHCASVAGRLDLPITGYHIPCFIYGPQLVAPQKMERLTSQIDLIPTIFGLMNLPYDTKFYGYDMLKLEPGRERAFISTYQKLGYIKNNKLIVLSPKQGADCYQADFNTGNGQKISMDSVLLNEAIALYQSASYLYRNELYGKK
jgi:phosphoglycerol transferase MdoB-like AlkP superfamily enzyme